MSADQAARAGDGIREALALMLETFPVPIRTCSEDIWHQQRAIDAARAALAAAPAVSAPAGWISVADRLPPKFAEVMIAFAGSALPSTGQYTGNLRDSADGWSYPSENSGDDTDWTVTHWRPLPEHPEAHRFAGSPDAAALAAVQAPATVAPAEGGGNG